MESSRKRCMPSTECPLGPLFPKRFTRQQKFIRSITKGFHIERGIPWTLFSQPIRRREAAKIEGNLPNRKSGTPIEIRPCDSWVTHKTKSHSRCLSNDWGRLHQCGYITEKSSVAIEKSHRRKWRSHTSLFFLINKWNCIARSKIYVVKPKNV